MVQTSDFRKLMRADAEEAASRQLVALVDLGESDCHRPIGDPLETPAVYCGRPAIPGKQYCHACHDKMFMKIEVRRRVETRSEHQNGAVRVRIYA